MKDLTYDNLKRNKKDFNYSLKNRIFIKIVLEKSQE